MRKSINIWDEARWFCHDLKEAQNSEVTTLQLLTGKHTENTLPHLLLLVKDPKDIERLSLFSQAYFHLNVFTSISSVSCFEVLTVNQMVQASWR